MRGPANGEALTRTVAEASYERGRQALRQPGVEACGVHKLGPPSRSRRFAARPMCAPHRNRHPPGCDLLRAKFRLSSSGENLAWNREQPAQLLEVQLADYASDRTGQGSQTAEFADETECAQPRRYAEVGSSGGVGCRIGRCCFGGRSACPCPAAAARALTGARPVSAA